MLLPDFDYHRATSVPHALDLLHTHPGARPLAGGQTLINAMKLRLAAPAALVDISTVDELRQIRTTATGTLHLGAGVTYAELAGSAEVRAAHPVLAEVAAGTVDRQVRNRGTLGGNVCLAEPTSNFPPLLVALAATLHVGGPAGERTVPADEFFTGPLRVALAGDELLTGVELPALPPDAAVGYRSLRKAPDSWALARAVAWVRSTADRIVAVRVVLGCVAPIPLRALAMERALAGRPPTEAAVAGAAGLIDDLDPPADVHASGEYRQAMTRVVACRAVLAALEPTRTGGQHAIG